MPRLPENKTNVKRVACRYYITKVDSNYWAKAFDQGGNRYPEADYLSTDREKVVFVARERVNNSYSAKTKTKK